MDGTDFKDFKAKLLSKQGVRNQYEALNPKYAIIQAIIARRNELSLSQRGLARLAGMQQPAICRLERGDNNITVGTLFRVADALNFDIEFKPRTLVKA
ncbi:MAG: helix-turn-helix transcriptional regulator [Bacteroidales bacterium]|nr:helix-turn-helix transcriptional regulator [Bacteroidales bacterium]